MKVPKLQPWT